MPRASCPIPRRTRRSPLRKRGKTEGGFAADGSAVAVTRLVAGPCVVVQVRNHDRDGYTAVQVGFGERKHIGKALAGHFKKLGEFRHVREFRVDEAQAASVEVGKKITADTFAAGDVIAVTGTSKGKGFQGVMKRHGFHGQKATHGHKDQGRMPGSVSAGGVQHVFKGTRMGGRMGADQVTVKNLHIIEVNPQANEVFVSGAVPGARNNLVLLHADGELIFATDIEPIVEIPVAEETAEVAETVESTEESKEETTVEETPVEAEPAPIAEEPVEEKAQTVEQK